MTDEHDRRDQDAATAPASAGATGGVNGMDGADGAGGAGGAAGADGADGAPTAAGQGAAGRSPAAAGAQPDVAVGAAEPGFGDAAELARLKAEVQSLNDRHLRLAAEFDNYRKRSERERSEQHQRSQAALAARLLDALDDLQRVEHFDPATVTSQSLLEALELVERKFRQALEASGLEEVQAQGEIFDPRMMEAVMAVPAEHPEEDEVVADVFRKGYRFGNTLVRPAQVRVKKYEG